MPTRSLTKYLFAVTIDGNGATGRDLRRLCSMDPIGDPPRGKSGSSCVNRAAVHPGGVDSARRAILTPTA
jgi:hypothetical protein